MLHESIYLLFGIVDLVGIDVYIVIFNVALISVVCFTHCL